MVKNKKILIVSYVFPPSPGIGGRRWAKFAKYLTREDYDVHVICATCHDTEKSVWVHDVEDNDRIHIHEVNAFFPRAFTGRNRSLIDRVFYKFWQLVVRMLFKGYIYDRVVFSGNSFVARTKEIVKQYEITDVVVSGAPFRLVYFITRLRKQWPQFKLLVDFRDPWTWEPGGDYQRLKVNDLIYEKRLEAFVMQEADFVSVPTKNMFKYLNHTYPHFLDKCFTLPHAWDEDEIKLNFKIEEEVIRLIWFGTLYNGLDEYIKPLSEVIARAKGKIILDIFSDSYRYKDLFQEAGANSWVAYYSLMPSRELYLLVRNYKASLIINNDTDKDHVSTKFIELAASQTPVIYIANDGKASDFVKSNGLGWHVKKATMNEFFEQMIDGTVTEPIPVLEINELSFRNVTRDLIANITTPDIVTLSANASAGL